ncbi:MAG TPA: glutamate--tRNA ligase [Tepidisphaeraceae bacterium]|jgi:glutamyl-tRNA synthetase
MPTPAVVDRFAPSPTGYLHVGGARTALFNWLLARHTGGRFLLRIEDTDLARSTEQAMLQLLEDLRWLGLQWDNADLVFQSRRLDVYNRLIDDLIARGLAYKAYDTTEELDAMRKEAEKARRQFVYRRGPVSAEEAARHEAQGRVPVVRFIMPVQEYRFTDEVLGEIALPADEADHFVIRKSDGMPTYHFAVVVDDAEMGITHVLRGQEHTKNTFRHIALQEALGYARPAYAHLTTIQNPDGSKMGKRDRDKAVRQRAQEWLKSSKKAPAELASLAKVLEERVATWLADSKKQLDIPEQLAVIHVIGLSSAELPEILIHDFRKNGYLPEALLNFLALLGWSPGGDRERMSMGEMVQLFSLDRVGKSNPKFDRAKLLAFNTEAAAAAPIERLVNAFRDYLSVNPESPLNNADDAALAKLLQMKKGFRLLREVDEASRFLFTPDEQIVYAPDAVEKVLRKQNGFAVLKDLRGILVSLHEWTAGELDAAVKQYAEQKGLGLGKVAQPLRVAVSGTTISPPIFESLEFLGRERTLARIDRCLALE